MTDLVGRTLDRLAAGLPGQVSSPSDAGYAAATAIWSKLVGLVPRALGHCRLSNDAALAVRARSARSRSTCPIQRAFRTPCPRTGPASCIAARFAKAWPGLKLRRAAGRVFVAGDARACSASGLRSREASTAIGRAAA